VPALSAAEAEKLSGSPAAKDFVADAFAHCKFVGFTDAASPPLTATGVDKLLDEGFVQPENGKAAAFVRQCRQLRYWPREQALNGSDHR
jgi:catalase